jgi:hypothetical protein
MSRIVVGLILLTVPYVVCPSGLSQDSNDSNTRSTSNTYTICQYGKASLKRIPLPPSSGCSFLVGRWIGQTSDGAIIDETWLPFVDENTLGIRRIFKNTTEFEFFEIAPRLCNDGTQVQARILDQNLGGGGELITGRQSLYVQDEEATFYFSPNSGGLDAIIYTKTSDDQIRLTIKKVVNGEASEQSFDLARAKTDSARKNSENTTAQKVNGAGCKRRLKSADKLARS